MLMLLYFCSTIISESLFRHNKLTESFSRIVLFHFDWWCNLWLPPNMLSSVALHPSVNGVIFDWHSLRNQGIIYVINFLLTLKKVIPMMQQSLSYIFFSIFIKWWWFYYDFVEWLVELMVVVALQLGWYCILEKFQEWINHVCRQTKVLMENADSCPCSMKSIKVIWNKWFSPSTLWPLCC